MDELTNLEKQIYLLVQKNNQLSDNINEFIKVNDSLRKENEVLKLKLEELESLKDHSSSNISSFKVLKKEELKKQIDEIVKVIDYHLGS